MIAKIFHIIMAIGFAFAAGITLGVVASMGFGPEYMRIGFGIGFVFGGIGGWLRK